MTAGLPPLLPASEMLRHRFAPRARDRGLLYYRRGAVRITHASQGTVLAVVQGTRRYRVELRQTSDALGVSCSCPAFEAGPCKHIWATLLAAEERGLLDRRRDDPAAIGVGAPPPLQSNGPEPHFDHPDNEDLDDLDLDASDADLEEDWDAAMPLGPGRLSLTRSPLSPHPPRSDWRDRLDAVARVEASSERAELPKGQIVYVVDVLASQATGVLALEVARRRQSKKGDWSEPAALRLPGPAIPHLPDPDDREVLALLHGASADNGYGAYVSYGASGSAAYRLYNGLDHLLLPRLCATGRCFLRRDRSSLVSPLRWDDGPPWELWLDMREAGERYVVAGQLRRSGEARPLEEPVLVLDRIAVFEGVAARFEHARSLPLVLELRRRGALEVPRSQALLAAERLLQRPGRLRLSVPPDLRFAEDRPAPIPHLRLRAHPESWNDQLVCALSFDYDGVKVEEADPNWCVVRTGERRLVVRDREAEQKEAAKLPALRFRRVGAGPRGPGSLQLAPRHLASVVRALLAEGWRVEADGKLHRPARSVRMEVVSGIDWFDLKGAVDFEGTVVSLPAVLAALRRGETAIALGDGTVGMLPEDWLKRYGSMAAFGTSEKDALRFRRSQAGLLDALLASQPDVAFDSGFREARSALRAFDGVRPAEQPKGFAGVLREYQRQGLGWLHFLDRFGFGGCLADDMGLGKTVQVLALLETRRRARKGVEARPSLVVVPRSLMFNWRDEAAR
ncbi:MAG TPA: SNF2-related protein, partial [Vicinamibacteria bacterium]|nr:SNF2-related protein [Vicinamibacteria bacterium]